MGSVVPAPGQSPSTLKITVPTTTSSTDAAVSASFVVHPKQEPLEPSLQIPQTPIPNSAPPLFLHHNNTYSPISHPSSFSSTKEPLQVRDCAVSPISGSIVTVNESQNDKRQLVVSRSKPRRQNKRSGELVRATNISPEEQRHYRHVVRRARMVYDALRTQLVVEEEKRQGPGLGKRSRGDLRAAVVMRDRGLWLNFDKRIVGSIPGVEIGDLFLFRMELCVLGLHGQTQAGIDYVPISKSSVREPIATSIIVSGGYEDNDDSGNVIIYTGQGGQDKYSRQCQHQKLERGNLALERSMKYEIEVRVIRGIKYDGSISGKVYVYDGLYRIIDCWFDVGKSSFGVYKYRLSRIDGQPEMGSEMLRVARSRKLMPLMVMPRSYLSLDMSNGKENVQVLLFNDIDDNRDPLNYEYLARTVFPPFVFFNQGTSGCDCVYGCGGDSCLCAVKNGGELLYDQNNILLKGKPVIFECGPSCGCPKTCRNRVAQLGLRTRLEVFRLHNGWGVRSLDLIQAGAFICEYAGIVLTMEQSQIFSMNGDSLIYPYRFSERWTEWGDFSAIDPGYMRPSYPSIPPLDFAMDVSNMRNVGCYMRHSSTPNVLVQCVLHDHNNLMFPRLMLFAMENIPPLRELVVDYGMPDERKSRLAICN